jgi:hypothetical protein
MSSHCHLLVKICRKLLSLFIKCLLLHVTTHKMSNLVDTYNTYIEYIEEASFCGLTMRSNALERYPTCRGSKVVEIRECVTHHKVLILELNNYLLTRLVILDVVVMKLDTIFSCFTEPVGS